MTAPAPIDEYDKLYTYCDNVGNPTTFIDACSTPKTITANGNATQLPIKFNKSAGFFNGTTDYVVVPTSANFAPRTGAFTIEMFVNPNLLGTDVIIYDTRSASGSAGIVIYKDSGNHINFLTVSADRISGTNALVLNSWNHIMLVGNGGANGSRTVKLYLNGVQEGSTWTSDYDFSDTLCKIGVSQGITNFWSGWMKELRVSNIARTVAVPTTQYQTDANTVLLMHFDTPATSPLGPAIAFDGTGDYLELADSADWDVGTGPITIEAWINPSTISGDHVIVDRAITNDFILSQHGSSINFGFGGGSVITGSSVLVANKWVHVAGVRSGTGADQTKLYVNGIEVASGTYANNVSSSSILRIGAETNGNYPFIGSMREIRISNVARYTAPFTPSQTGFTVDANTKLYIKGDENNGVTTFVDSETTPKTVTTNGDTKIKYTEDYRSCIFKDETGKFPYPVGSAKVDFFAIGSGVGYFESSGSAYISCTPSADFNLNGGNWTFESYFRTNTLPAANFLSGSAGFMYLISKSATTGKIAIALSSNGTSWDIDSSFVGASNTIVNTWYHLSVVFDGSSYKIWLNGTLDGTKTTSTQTYSSNTAVAVGSYLDGLLDNIRISKGVARYTATFNPPDYGGGEAGSANYGRFFLVF